MSDLKELQHVIAPNYKYITAFVTSAVFDETLSAIQDQEDEFCRSVRDIGRKMRNKVTKIKRESVMEERGNSISGSKI